MSTISTLEACAIPLIIHNCPVTTGLNSQSNPGPWPVFHACYVFAPFPKSCAYQWVVVNADSLIPDLFIADLGESQTLPSGGPTSHDDTRSLIKAFILSDFQFFFMNICIYICYLWKYNCDLPAAKVWFKIYLSYSYLMQGYFLEVLDFNTKMYCSFSPAASQSREYQWEGLFTTQPNIKTFTITTTETLKSLFLYQYSWLPYSTDFYFHDFVFVFVSWVGGGYPPYPSQANINLFPPPLVTSRAVTPVIFETQKVWWKWGAEVLPHLCGVATAYSVSW